MQQNGNGQLAKSELEDDFIILDPRSANGVAMPMPVRMNAIATISAGYKGSDDLPKRSKEGEIYLHGDAPNLERALKANDGKFLTVMFPSNSPKEFIQQRFVEYSSSALLAYGDEDEITQISSKSRTTHKAGTPAYVAAIAKCRVSVSVYFTLAEWHDSGARMLFQDGLGLYRLRFTSINSLHSILSSLQYVKKMNRGCIIGVPFDLFLRSEEHAAADGKRRANWIWQVMPRPPKGVTLDAAQFRAFADYGQSQMELLQLTAPQPETLDDAIGDVETIATTGDEAIEGEVVSNESQPDPEPAKPETKPAADETPALCDARDYQKKYFAIAGQTSFAGDEGRAQFVMAQTQGKMKSLSQVLSVMTAEQADEFLKDLKFYVEKEVQESQQQKTTPPATNTTPAANAPDAPDPLKRHKKKIISQAKELYGDEYKSKMPAVLGQPNWGGLTAKDLDSTIAMLNRMIKVNEPATPAVAAPAAAPNLELTPDPEPESYEPAKTPLSEKVREKRVAASMPADDDEPNPFDDDDFNVNVDGEVIE